MEQNQTQTNPQTRNPNKSYLTFFHMVVTIRLPRLWIKTLPLQRQKKLLCPNHIYSDRALFLGKETKATRCSGRLQSGPAGQSSHRAHKARWANSNAVLTANILAFHQCCLRHFPNQAQPGSLTWHCQKQMHFKTQGLLCDHLRDKQIWLSIFCPQGSTAYISCCPLEALLECQFSPTSAWHTKIKQVRRRTESTDKHFTITSISWRMSLNFEFNKLWSLPSVRTADPTQAGGQMQTNTWAVLLAVTVIHRQWP